MKHLLSSILLFIMTASSQAQSPDPWTEYMTPGEVHTLFEEYTGQFKMEVTMPMAKAMSHLSPQ